MLKYLIIQLDDTSVSYCHYGNKSVERNLIPLELLQKAIQWAMKENLSVQFVYPNYKLPISYYDLIETIDHIDIAPVSAKQDADILIYDNWDDIGRETSKAEVAVLRTTKLLLFHKYNLLKNACEKFSKINLVIIDVESFTEEDFQTYDKILKYLSKIIEEVIISGKSIQFNLLTDRMFLKKMNNCNAGFESITLAPNGKFYICPAYYLDNDKNNVGDVESGLNIPNSQLYRLNNAPICRNCDAFQCHRCIWLNEKTTLEVNTPSREQCVLAHIERNASRELLLSIREKGEFLKEYDIPKINYLDPFDLIEKK